MPQRLPLFPLGSVLFPGLVLPLNVFEPRYRRLVQDLVAEEREGLKGFGVVAIRSGHEVGEGNARALHDVGCVALLREVTELEDGRYELVTVGATRFRLLGIDTEAGTPYPTGLVEPYGDDEDEADEDEEVPVPADVAALARAVEERFAQYRDQLGIGGAGAPGDPSVLSYLVAAAAVLPLDARQRLLEAPDTRSRLTEELALLKQETALVAALGTVPASELPGEPPNPN
ncbi:LON peptidase substrate-binding domain-containing protein [Kineococcus esterisolvens]|uniref:LON peptidase substrate-binding domain-containing protein n=1 Tax=unclassified Kineococcus TaxID=2621656 RepID=UPI003D7D158C